MLDDDGRVTPGWLAALLETVREYREAKYGLAA